MDLIGDHVAALAAALDGPERLKARLLEDLRDGLTDTAAALVDEGVPEDRAASRAVREFGTVEEIAPSFQRELTIAQARRTARTVAVGVPFLIVCWQVLGAAGQRLPPVAQLLAVHVGGVAAVAALLAAASLAATGALGRRMPTPRRLPHVVAWTGTTAGAALGIGALTLTVAALLASNWALGALIGGLTIVSHAKVAASARACRQCARLPVSGPAPARSYG
ncbi:permease prefix domain 1-containing protein [Actinomadura viridis]|uniref:permease prefix domain 1-containing protein n=1 Tax=Actinomadura viridis TaxID=58110 RepID=UPI0036BA3EFB